MGDATTGEPLAETAKVAFRLDGLLLRWKEAFAHWNTSLDHFLLVMRNYMESVREPKDYADESDFERGVKAGRQMGARFSNGGDEDSTDIKKWIAGVGVILAASGVIGGWTLSNQVAALTAKVDERMKAQDDRITRIEQQQANERR